MSKNNGLSAASIRILVSRVTDWAQARVETEKRQDKALWMAATQAYENHPKYNNSHMAISVPLNAKLLADLNKEGVEVVIKFGRGNAEYLQLVGLIPDNSPTLAKLRKAHNIPPPFPPAVDKNTVVYHSLESKHTPPICCLKSDAQHVLNMLAVIEDAVLAGDGVAVAFKLNDMMEAIK